MRSHPIPSGSPVRVCVIGLGYIGLPTAAVLAQAGHEVIGVDVRPDVVETINQGKIHIHEPHLDTAVRDAVASGRLKAQLTPGPADFFFLCVPTPVHKDRAPDLTYVESAARAIRPYVEHGNTIVLESTSPPGTTEKVVLPAAVPDGWRPGHDVFLAHCPERVLPGRIMVEIVENDRIIGGLTPACTQRVIDFYRTFVEGDLLPTSAITAELAKLVENAYRDVNIAFANELSMLSEHFAADPWEVIELANRHPRVQILNPGPGVGGHCISVDPWFLTHSAPQWTPLIRTAREVNDSKAHYVVAQIEDLCREQELTTIGCLGLAYKADVDDLRESPSMTIVEELISRRDFEVLACDPYVRVRDWPRLPLHPLDHVLERSQLIVLLTDHAPFRTLDPGKLAGKHVLDTRGTWRSSCVTAAPVVVHSMRRAA